MAMAVLGVHRTKVSLPNKVPLQVEAIDSLSAEMRIDKLTVGHWRGVARLPVVWPASSGTTSRTTLFREWFPDAIDRDDHELILTVNRRKLSCSPGRPLMRGGNLGPTGIAVVTNT